MAIQPVTDIIGVLQVQARNPALNVLIFHGRETIYLCMYKDDPSPRVLFPPRVTVATAETVSKTNKSDR